MRLRLSILLLVINMDGLQYGAFYRYPLVMVKLEA